MYYPPCQRFLSRVAGLLAVLALFGTAWSGKASTNPPVRIDVIAPFLSRVDAPSGPVTFILRD